MWMSRSWVVYKMSLGHPTEENLSHNCCKHRAFWGALPQRTLCIGSKEQQAGLERLEKGKAMALCICPLQNMLL